MIIGDKNVEVIEIAESPIGVKLVVSKKELFFAGAIIMAGVMAAQFAFEVTSRAALTMLIALIGS